MSHGREYRDALTTGPVKGRGAGLNPGNRFEPVRLHVLGEHLDEITIERQADGDNPSADVSLDTSVFRDRSRSILSHFDSPDMGSGWSVNPYRGCEHGCVYCYARPGHEYLGWSSGIDFETRILAKPDAPELLRAELTKSSWEGATLMISGVTDPYQPVERHLRITRRILELCAELAQPVTIITKNPLVTRDADLLAELARFNAATVAVSITSLDNQLASWMEPRAGAPSARLEAVRALTAAGVPVIVMVAPIIPSINDAEVPRILEAAARAGAIDAGHVVLRLPHQNKDLFLEWLRRHFPDRAAKVESQVCSMHGGKLYDSRWFVRRRGQGVLAGQIEQAFEMFSKRFGLGARRSRNVNAIGPRTPRNAEFLLRKRDRENRGQLGLFA